MATKNTTKKSTSKKNTSKSKSDQLSREVWGVIYIVLAGVTLFAIWDFDGFLLGFLNKIITFCIGFGIYILPFSFIVMSIYCFFPFVGNVPLRTTCILGFPLTIGCFAHILMYGDTYKLNLDNLALIIEDGLQAKSAGFVGGFISIILEASLSSVGALILLSVLNVVSFLIGFRLSPKKILKSFIDMTEQIKQEEIQEGEYTLSKLEKRKAKKEKQKEYNERLKEEKARAYNQYKEEIPEESLKKPKNFDINLSMGSAEHKIVKPKSEKEVIEEQAKEEPKQDLWFKDTYKKIKERDDLERAEKLRKKQEAEKNINEPVLEDELANNIQIPKLKEDIDKPIVNNEVIENLDAEKIDYIMEDLSEIKLVDKSNDVVQIKENNQDNVIEFPFNAVDDEKQEQQFEKFDPLEVIQEIEQTLNDDTQAYTPLKQEIIPDLLKSTMEFTPANNFDAKNLKYKYIFPSINLLQEKIKGAEFDPRIELEESSKRLIETLASFGVKAEIIHIVRGPSITRFEITISQGTKMSKVEGLSADIALALGAVSVRIAPIPEKIAIGLEIPNKTTEMVFIREVLGSNEFKSTTSKLSYALGYDITGSPAIGDIAKMPHMLVAGTTGSGKSVCINSMLVSLLYKADPTEVKFILVDPKMVELGGYNGIPHLLIPVVTDPKKAAGALNWAVGEMMKRYKLLAECNVKNLEAYNILMEQRIANGDTEAEKLPQIVIVIDELADLMMIAAKEIEESICRIAQMARAAGMHLVIATQRPSSDVITGLMKSNIPSRISFAVSSQMDSRIILDVTGAEKLIGKGDMLYNPLGSKPLRLQGCFITSSEVEAVVEYVKSVAQPDYSEEVLNHIENHSAGDATSGASSDSCGDDEDPMIDEAIEIIVSTGQASTSFLQRKLRLGYARASRIMDQIEERGIISKADGSKPRQILISKTQWQEMQIRKMD